ncbi:hypothetical protein BDY17DRAFT_320871 [Neohortaea acidophila]|uniref:Uncharacterized protein n=1 Tax=Neohortaea acidophila TaxID=245834 RepID=A0A6A6Q1Z8_9PEZI|nr:uncharacterized protein BDY17DRAFT_320871 [Neohortaea acidophila]KAF2486041.1 hypothetical protein BDY17DRAFT_320871 [Neohortaea acidophila]
MPTSITNNKKTRLPAVKEAVESSDKENNAPSTKHVKKAPTKAVPTRQSKRASLGRLKPRGFEPWGPHADFLSPPRRSASKRSPARAAARRVLGSLDYSPPRPSSYADKVRGACTDAPTSLKSTTESFADAPSSSKPKVDSFAIASSPSKSKTVSFADASLLSSPNLTIEKDGAETKKMDNGQELEKEISSIGPQEDVHLISEEGLHSELEFLTRVNGEPENTGGVPIEATYELSDSPLTSESELERRLDGFDISSPKKEEDNSGDSECSITDSTVVTLPSETLAIGRPTSLPPPLTGVNAMSSDVPILEIPQLNLLPTSSPTRLEAESSDAWTDDSLFLPPRQVRRRRRLEVAERSRLARERYFNRPPPQGLHPDRRLAILVKHGLIPKDQLPKKVAQVAGPNDQDSTSTFGRRGGGVSLQVPDFGETRYGDRERARRATQRSSDADDEMDSDPDA